MGNRYGAKRYVEVFYIAKLLVSFDDVQNLEHQDPAFPLSCCARTK